MQKVNLNEIQLCTCTFELAICGTIKNHFHEINEEN